MTTNLWLSCILVLSQIDPWDGAKGSEELLQVCLTSVLRQIGHTNGSIVISCEMQSYILCEVTLLVAEQRQKKKRLCKLNTNTSTYSPLRLGCMDSPLRVPPSLRLGGTYFPVLLWAGCAGSGSAYVREERQATSLVGTTMQHLKSWQSVHEKSKQVVPEPAGFSLSPVESPSCSASSFCMGPRVSLYGQRVVQWSPLQIRQDTIFCPLSLFIGSSSWSWAFRSCKRQKQLIPTVQLKMIYSH